MHFMGIPGMGLNGFHLDWIFMMFFWGLVILGVIYLFKHISSNRKVSVSSENAEEILKRRYAIGEISKEKYHDKMFVIKGKS